MIRLVVVVGLVFTPGVVVAATARVSQTKVVAIVSSGLREQLAHVTDLSTLVPLEIVSTSDPAPFVRSLGGRVDADIAGRVVAARVPAGRVADLAKHPGVANLFASQRLAWSLDRSIPDIQANAAWSLKDPAGLPLEGKDVLVGIVDSGIDYRNLDFKNPDGSTRIRYIWDQTLRGNPPAGYDFGYECDSTSIDSGTCPETDTEGHGTHVAGIAAGNGRSSSPPTEIGVAPQADLIVVKSTATSGGVIAAWQYLVDRAKQLGEPIAINNSFGSQTGPHDGTEAESRAIDALAGPGRLFVAAAGNEANQGVHTSGTVAQGGSATVTVHTKGALYDLPLSVFYAADAKFTATLTGPDGTSYGPVAFNQVLQQQYSQDRDTRVSIDGRPWDATHSSVLVSIQRNPAASPLSGDWTLTLRGTPVSGGGRYDAWLGQGTSGLQAFANPDESDTISYPADARSVIAVGNYVTRASWTDSNNVEHSICDLIDCAGGPLQIGAIEPHSSSGPTADGRQKPDLAAPGAMIESSRSHDTPVCPASRNQLCLEPALLASGGQDVFELGTIMSAPHVTGTVALMLRANRTLDPTQAIAMLRATARHDAHTETSDWSPQFGAGKLDAYAAVQAALRSARPTTTPTPSPTAMPRPAMSFAFESVRLETTAGKAARAIAGRPVVLAARVRFTNAVKGTRVTRHWTVKLVGKSVAQHAVAGALPSAESKTYRWAWSFTPKATGSYTLTVGVTAAGQTRQKSVSFTARRS